MKTNSSSHVNNQVFVEPDKEQEYCRNNNVRLEKLDNGITIVGISRQVTDLARASLNFTFCSGSYFDPSGKEGLHHFAEHLLANQKVRQAAHRLDVDFNASTSPTEIKLASFGPISPSVKGYGLLKTIPLIFLAITDPFRFLPKHDQLITKEKQVILAEINNNFASHDWQTGRFLRTLVLDPVNPTVTENTGTADSVNSITGKDISAIFRKILIPSNLTINILTEGGDEICPILVNHCRSVFKQFPNLNQPRQILNWPTTELTNPNFKPGNTYRKDTGLKNQLVSVLFVWLLERQPFSPDSFALSRLNIVLSDRFFDFCRKNGWGYYIDVGLFTPNLSAGALYFRLDIPALLPDKLKSFIKTIWPKVRQNVIGSLGKTEINRIISLERNRQKAIPIPTANRLDWLLLGLRQFGKIIDADKVKTAYSQINADDINKWRDYLLDHNPSIVVTGDLEAN